MNCPYCGEEIPEYSNLDFHVQTEHGFSVPAQYTQDMIINSMKDPDYNKIESYEVTQKQMEDARDWWAKSKLPHDKKWVDMRIGDRQRVIGRYANFMWNKYVAKERDLKPTGKNHGIDFYMDLALDDYLNDTTHTPEEYEKKLYGLEDTSLKRYGVPRDLPNGSEIVDSTYGVEDDSYGIEDATELHAKDWWDSKTIKNEKGDGSSRKWGDLHPDERKEIKSIFEDNVRTEYLGEKYYSNESWKCPKCGKEFGIANNNREGERFQHLMSHQATEGGFGSGKKGHVSWMKDMEYGGNYKICPNCMVNTSFENNKCTLCGN